MITKEERIRIICYVECLNLYTSQVEIFTAALIKAKEPEVISLVKDTLETAKNNLEKCGSDFLEYLKSIEE